MRERYGINGANALAQPLIQEPVILPAADRGVIIDFQTRKRLVPQRLFDKTPAREEEASTFGAFIQIFQKDGDNIACYSYPLPYASQDQARVMVSAIISPDKKPKYSYESNAGLLFMGEPGIHDIEEKYLAVPEEMLGVDQSKRRAQLDRGLRREFQNMQKGIRHSNAQDSEGQDMFTLSYKVEIDPETGEKGVFGLALNGEKRRLSKLPLDAEHTEMLRELEKTLLENDTITIVNFSKHKTVSLCCAKFFAEKLVKGVESMSERIKDFMSFYFGSGPRLNFVQEEKNNRCDNCGQKQADQHRCKE